jgi:hypothetical protein
MTSSPASRTTTSELLEVALYAIGFLIVVIPTQLLVNHDVLPQWVADIALVVSAPLLIMNVVNRPLTSQIQARKNRA